MIRLRLFKTAGVFVGANQRTGCKYSLRFYGRIRTVVWRVSNLTWRRLAVVSKTIRIF